MPVLALIIIVFSTIILIDFDCFQRLRANDARRMMLIRQRASSRNS